jgi:hypothetical protein
MTYIIDSYVTNQQFSRDTFIILCYIYATSMQNHCGKGGGRGLTGPGKPGSVIPDFVEGLGYSIKKCMKK